MDILQEVVAYLENVTGAPATARTLAKESLKGLPVYLAAA